MAGGQRLKAAARNIFLAVGVDDFIVERHVRAIFARLAPGGLPPGAVDEINGEASKAETQLASIAAAAASVSTPPFLEPFRATWWRNVTFLPGGAEKRKLAEEVKAALENFARRVAENPPPPNQALVISAPKLLATSVFAKTFKPVAEFAAFGGGGKPRERREAAMSMLLDAASGMGLSLSPQTAAAIVAKRGTDSRALASELDKIRDWLGPDAKEVSRKAVDEIVSPGSEPELWELTDAIAARDAARASSTIARFSGSDSSIAIALCAVLEKYFRDLSTLRAILDAKLLTPRGVWARRPGEGEAKRLEILGFDASAPLNFIQKRQLEAAASFRPAFLARAQALVASLRERIVSSSDANPLAALDMAVLKIISAAG